MRNRSLLLLVVSVLSALLLLFCLSGCKKTDVYGAASDFIKVSHPKTPNVNSFSDESANNDTSKGTSSTSSDNTATEQEPGTAISSNTTSSGDTTVNSGTKEASGKNAIQDNLLNNQEDENKDQGDGEFIIDNRGSDDITPVIGEPNPNL